MKKEKPNTTKNYRKTVAGSSASLKKNRERLIWMVGEHHLGALGSIGGIFGTILVPH